MVMMRRLSSQSGPNPWTTLLVGKRCPTPPRKITPEPAKSRMASMDTPFSLSGRSRIQVARVDLAQSPWPTRRESGSLLEDTGYLIYYYDILYGAVSREQEVLFMKRRAWALWLTLLLMVLVPPAPGTARAGEQSQEPLSEAAAYFRSNFGIAFKQVLVDISDTDTSKTVALMEGDLVLWPYLSFQSPTRYFGESSFGWLMEYGLSGFHIDKQSEPFTRDEAFDLGTGADGWFLYAMPTIAWHPSEDLRFGFGLGGGIMSVKGDALIYDPYPTVNRITYDMTELTWGAYLLSEYVFGNFMVGVHAGGLFTEKKPYDYAVTDASFILSYHKRW